METRLKLCYQVIDLFFIFSPLSPRTEIRGVRFFNDLLTEHRR